MSSVMIFGIFDTLDQGHENYIKQAKKHGEKIIAIVARDKTVQTIKGKAPENNEKTRLENLINTSWVDEAILGEIKDKHKVIKTKKPKVLALGYNQFAFTLQLENLIIKEKLDTKIVRLKPFQDSTFKSSTIKANKEITQNKNDESTKI